MKSRNCIQLVCLTLSLWLLTACGSKPAPAPPTETAGQVPEQPQTSPVPIREVPEPAPIEPAADEAAEEISRTTEAEEEQQRSPYLGEGNALVGRWRVRELDPLPGAPRQQIIVSYRDNGQFTSVVRHPGNGDALGPFTFRIDGRWRVQNRVLVLSDVSLRLTEGDEAAELIIDSLANQAHRLDSRSLIRELGEERALMTDQSGKAVRLDRLASS